MPGVFFTSDLHLGHGLVAELRGFSGTEEHDAELARRWDRTVRKQDDLVWILGDLTLTHPRYMFEWMAQRPGRKRVILGNHDAIHPMHRDAPRLINAHGWNQMVPDVFEFVGTMARIRVAGQSCLLSHFPYPGHSEGTDTNGRPFDDRYEQYRLVNLGTTLIHGHTHREDQLSFNGGARQIHIGPDAWNLTPVHIDQVARLILTGRH